MAVAIMIGCKEEEAPVIPVADFVSSTSMVMENSTGGTTIRINLDPEAGQAGEVVVSLTPGVNTTMDDFTTTPSAVDGEIILPFDQGATSVSFTVRPVDNDVRNEDLSISFALSSNSSQVQMGETMEHSLTIQDDEPELTIVSLSDLRSVYANDADNDSTFVEDVYIGGVVISTNDNVTSKNVFIQDHTGGIALRFQSDNTLTLGDTVSVNINGGTLSDFNGLVQVNNLPNANATSEGAGVMPTPAVITIEELNSDAYQSTLVTVQDVYFEGADGTSTVAGNTTFSDGVNTAPMRVENYAPFSSTAIPYGQGNLSGVAGIYYSPQLIPISASDIFESNPSSEITVTSSISDFGTVITNQVSASQSFTVSGTTLIGDITIEAPNNFEVSLTDVNEGFTNQVTVTKEDAEAGEVTVFVRFAPNTALNQVLTGEIAISTPGAVSKSIAVSGTEESRFNTIAFTSFEEGTTNSGRYTDTFDPLTDHDLINNDTEPFVDYDGSGNEMAIDAYYFNTLDSDGLTDGDYVGFTSYTGAVGEFVDGSQAYQLSDTDGMVQVTFETIDVSSYVDSRVSFSYFLDGTFGENEYLKIYVETGDETISLIDTTVDGLGDLGTWNELSSEFNGKASITLVVEFQTNGSSDVLYLDNVIVSGAN
ncbi:hypothetical protein DCC35_15515 [Mangrovivirga cuniculi]|uniref:DUF5689 domain-containing protein n=2 Tax=Mangrovivirga cuniculi TaxID=2715131 RepID=A0A4D7JN12_9BACT|nr:hypothetical protein DCC35_15515 [Mangrovivirga cuniculi]